MVGGRGLLPTSLNAPADVPVASAQTAAACTTGTTAAVTPSQTEGPYYKAAPRSGRRSWRKA